MSRMNAAVWSPAAILGVNAGVAGIRAASGDYFLGFATAALVALFWLAAELGRTDYTDESDGGRNE